MILILAPEDDVHATRVAARLKRRRAPHRVLDVSRVPGAASVSAWLGDAPLRARIDGLDLAAVKTVWLRRLRGHRPHPALARENAVFAASETAALGAGLARALADRFWVNDPVAGLATDGGAGKLHQLEVARRVGLEIPKTLMTNDPADARAFLAACPTGVVYKPFQSPERDGPRGRSVIFTTSVDAVAEARLAAVAYAPCIFQERVAKRVEVRATVLGDRVLACEIHSQERAETRTDFRRRYDGTTFRPHRLPAGVAAKVVAVHRTLGLVFGCCDLIFTPDGRYVFLETNQQGNWLWCEDRARLPLLDAFCDLLANASA